MQNAKRFFPVCLFLILLSLLFFFLIPIKATPETFGKTTVGSDVDEHDANTKASNIFTLTEDGYVTKITLYLKKWRYATSNPRVKCAIYDVDVAGAPTSLRGTTEEIVVDWETPKWQDFNLPSPVFLSAGEYRLAYMWDNPIVTYQDTGPINCYADKPITYSQEPTDPFGTVAKWRPYEKSIYATYTPSMVNPPTYSNIAHSTTIAGASVTFSCRWSDETGLSGYIFGTNNTGIPKNETWTAFSGNPDWANVTMTLNSNVGVRVEYWWYANDTSNNWGYTGINYLIVTALPDRSAAYIYRDGAFYYFNGSDAGFYFRFRGDGSSTGFTVMSHSNYGYNLACEMTGYAPLFWEYVDVISGESKQNEGGTLTVLRNASDFSLVKIHCPFSKMNHTIYYGFWKDKPYVWVYINRAVNEDMIPINAQTCHMWSRSLTQSWYTNYTGQIVNYNYTGAAYWFNNPLFAALDNGTMNRYPFMSHYDESINVTVGEIYTYATPNVRKDLRMWAFEFGPNYIETQIDWSTAGSLDTMYWRKGTVMGLEWLFFIKSGASNSKGNIADYSRQLLNNATNVWQDVENDFWSATHLPSRDPHRNYGVRGHTPYVASGFEYAPKSYYIPYAFMTSPTSVYEGMPYDVPITSKLLWRDNGGWIELDDREIAGTSYETVSQTDYIIGRISWDKGNYTLHEHVKAFSKSDKLIFYGNVTLDVDGSAWQSFFELYFNNIRDCVKINDLEYDLRWEDPVYGWIGIYIKANPGSITEFSDHLSIVLLNNTTPQSYPSGQSWEYNFTIWGHAGNASSMSSFFDLPTLKYKRLWYNYALDNDDFAFETMSEYCVINSTYLPDTLTIDLINTTKGDKNVEVFIKDKGQPRDVKVDDQSVNFEYDSTSKVCSFNVPFGSTKKIVIEWGKSVLIDQVFVTDERCDVGSVETVGFHAKWDQNNSDVVGGSVYVNETEYITNATGWISLTHSSLTVGKLTWVVTGVNCSGVTAYTQTALNPGIIWDRVQIVEGGVSSALTNISHTETVWFRAVYEYDNVTFDDSKGTLYVNGTAMAWSSSNNRWEKSFSFDTPGLRTFKISGVSDTQYSLTSINDEAGAQSITWELIIVTSLSIFLSPSPALVGFKLQIVGQLICQSNGSGISNVPVLLSYSIPSVETWDVIASVTTGMNGSFSVTWFTRATGNYVIKAVYAGDEISSIMGTETSVDLVITNIEKQIFSVSSNSTISALNFNSTAREITFTVTGPTGTLGYIDIFLAKSLVQNINDLKIYFDEVEKSYDAISLDDTWFIRLIYSHSTHVIRISLPPTSVPPVYISHEPIMLLTLSMIAIAITFLILKHARRRLTIRSKSTKTDCFIRHKWFIAQFFKKAEKG